MFSKWCGFQSHDQRAVKTRTQTLKASINLKGIVKISTVAKKSAHRVCSPLPRFHDGLDPIRCNLYADAQQDERDKTKNAVGGLWRDARRDGGRVSVAEVHSDAQQNHCDRNSRVRRDAWQNSSSGCVGTQSHHHDNTARPGCDWKREWVEDLLFQRSHSRAVHIRRRFLFPRLFLIQ